MREWKEKHGLRYFFNCLRSPDLAPIENAWGHVEKVIKQQPHWDEDSLRELAEEGWARLSQETINHWVRGMPTRLQHVVELGGNGLPIS